MLIYLDMCCLKRPFDDQSQARIRLESEAVLSLLASESPEVRFARSSALILENQQNPVKERAFRVGLWLAQASPPALDRDALEARAGELVGAGFKSFDALHVASAELFRADAFGTCDDRLLAAATRNRDALKVRVVHVVTLAQEVVK